MHTSTSTIRLSPGQAHWLRVEPGLMFIGVSGLVNLTESPRWLSETPWKACVTIHPGQAHAVAVRGWVQLSTDRSAELLCTPVASARSSAPNLTLTDLLRTLARRAFA